MSKVRNIFAKRIVGFRKTYKMNQKQVAEATGGITARAIGLYEAEGRSPSGEKIFLLSSCFGMTADYLLGISNIPYTPQSIENAMERYKEEFGTSPIRPTLGKSAHIASATENIYSLEVCANIITVRRILERSTLTERERKQFEQALSVMLRTGQECFHLTS